MLGTIWQIVRGKPLAGLHLYRLLRPSGALEAVVTSEGDQIAVATYLGHLKEQGWPKRAARRKLDALPVRNVRID